MFKPNIHLKCPAANVTSAMFHHTLESRVASLNQRFTSIERGIQQTGAGKSCQVTVNSCKSPTQNMLHVMTENVEVALKDLFAVAVKTAFPGIAVPQMLITVGRKTEFQCNNAMALAKLVKRSPLDVGKMLSENMPENDLIESVEPSDQGFINITIRKDWLGGAVKRVLSRGITPPVLEKESILVDFSSPNIAKDMHVGHLRSTIIGESLCRIFEFCGHKVRRINHVGDWGTQFGMLILYLKQQHPDFLDNPPNIKDLVQFYKASKKYFDEDPKFKENARLEVVKLQRYEPESIKAWQLICDASRKEFQEIYSRLHITLEERGESFYNEMIPSVIAELEKQGNVQVSDGAHIILSTEAKPVDKLEAKDMAKLLSSQFIHKLRDNKMDCDPVLLSELQKVKVLTTDNEMMLKLGNETKKWSEFDANKDMDKLAKAMEKLYKPTLAPALLDILQKNKAFSPETKCVAIPRFAFPLMVRKSDGGFTYDSTDMAAIHHRFQVEKNDRVVYVTDVGQFEHFRMVGQAASDAGWISPKQRWQHAGFGLVSGADGRKLKTRSGETTKLRDLLDEACDRSLEGLRAREKTDQKQGHSEEEMRRLSRIIGYGAVKYFDLKQNRTTDYKFDYDNMLSFDGNTAVFLLYTYARICSIKTKAKTTSESIRKVEKVDIVDDAEKELALTALKFQGIIEKTQEDLFPHHLCDYVYDLVGKLNSFYQRCRVIGSESQSSRLALCELTGATIARVLELLGIEVAERL